MRVYETGTLDFIDHLLEWSRAIPLYIVTLARPELLERRPDWGAGRRNFTSLYLEPLPPMAMRALLAGLVPGLPESAARSIVARADGIPLYAVETVRMLLAEGRLAAADDGTYTPVGDLSSLAIPETLTALIAARLDGLDPADRGLVLDAAVLGQSFSPAGLAAVSGIEEATLEPRLRALVRRELLAHETDPRSPERGQYAFVQALIREVAYNTLAKRDRKVRHLAAAHFFESLGSDELAGALAGHYLAARENAPDGPEADALAAQARVALRGAAERAAELGAHEQALAFCEQALTVTIEPGDRAELLERAGDEASAAGHHETAERHLSAAIDAQSSLGNRPAIARATTALGRALNQAYRTSQAATLLEPAAAELADLAADPAVIALGGELARTYLLSDETERAIEVADGVLAAAEHADLGAIVADTLVTKGTALAFLGRSVEGLGVLLAGQDLADAQGNGLTLLRGFINRSSVLGSRDPRAALETARDGIVMARRLGRRTVGIIVLTNAAEAALRTGDWPWALAELESALDDELEASDRLPLIAVLGWLKALRDETVADSIDEVTRIVGTSADPQTASYAEFMAAYAAFGSGRLVDARTAWHRGSQINVEYLPV